MSSNTVNGNPKDPAALFAAVEEAFYLLCQAQWADPNPAMQDVCTTRRERFLADWFDSVKHGRRVLAGAVDSGLVKPHLKRLLERTAKSDASPKPAPQSDAAVAEAETLRSTLRELLKLHSFSHLDRGIGTQTPEGRLLLKARELAQTAMPMGEGDVLERIRDELGPELFDMQSGYTWLRAMKAAYGPATTPKPR